jgi:hypothetical protein
MIGFIPTGALSISAFSGASVAASPRVVPAVAKWTMAKSPSVPFMEEPKSLSPDLPGYAGFDPLGISDCTCYAPQAYYCSWWDRTRWSEERPPWKLTVAWSLCTLFD